MNCDEVRRLADASVDGELDVARQTEIETHLDACADCSRVYLAERQTRDLLQKHDLYCSAPAGLDGKVRQAVSVARGATSRPAWYQRRQWASLAAAALVVVAVGAAVTWISRTTPGRGDPVVQDAVAAHIRSLLPGHLTDVPSSDQHTVKPWFAGRVDFSPPVPDFAARGFTLVGGRLDYLEGRIVAVGVYKRRQHIVNLFMWPAAAAESLKMESSRGYNVVRWSRDGVAYCLVSDLNSGELREFAGMFGGG